MATAEAQVGLGQLLPPYIPVKTFVSFIEKLKANTIPQAIDKSMLGNLSGAVQSHLLITLRFFGLTEGKSNTVTPALEKLVESCGTPGFKDTLRELLLDSYAGIIGDLNVGNATAKQLDDVFARQKLDGVMRDRAVRFYLKALTLAGVQTSPYLGKRKPKGSGTSGIARAKKAKAAAANNAPAKDDVPPADVNTQADKVPTGLIEFPIPLGTTKSCIRVPLDIKTSQIPLVRAIFSAVEALAEQNSAGAN